MTNRELKLEQWLEDAVAFMDLANAEGNESMIQSTLIHDIVGLFRRDAYFLPRVDGYANLDREELK